MPKNSNISMSVIKRLPRYYRFLGELNRCGITRISSRELSIKMGLTASQIRQDFNCFGGFGQQGYGYNVTQLHIEIGNILGLNNGFKTILIGTGNLGRAIATHMSFEERGFNLIGIFDKNEATVGQLVRGLPIRHINGLDDFCREYHPTVAVLCIPSEHALEVEKQLVDLGIKGFWNFTHSDIASKYPDVVVENVHLSDSLMTLCYQVSSKFEERE
ncbi:MAG: redox-sensing transcriptional repressor Rex [Clostridiales bacterium]|nr:redox-sensing transcriptional repressor Rex [Clostridiales bacterium]